MRYYGRSGIFIRSIVYSDWESFRQLEEEVWASQHMDTVSKDMFASWVHDYQEGFLGAFKNGSLVGYTFCIRTLFEETFLSSGSLDKIAKYAFTRALDFHYPVGNAWYGVSFASSPYSKGVGYLLVETLFERATDLGVKYFYCTVRLPFLSSYFLSQGIKNPDREQSRIYALLSVQKIQGRVYPRFKESRIVPSLIPPSKKEPIISLMVGRFACELADVVKVEDFKDTASCNYGASLWRYVVLQDDT